MRSKTVRLATFMLWYLLSQLPTSIDTALSIISVFNKLWSTFCMAKAYMLCFTWYGWRLFINLPMYFTYLCFFQRLLNWHGFSHQKRNSTLIFLNKARFFKQRHKYLSSDTSYWAFPMEGSLFWFKFSHWYYLWSSNIVFTKKHNKPSNSYTSLSTTSSKEQKSDPNIKS